jgi:hypothetical protein
MKKILITIDDETVTLLDSKVNKSEYVRQALKVYNEDISTETILTLKKQNKFLWDKLKDMDSKIDYIASKL